MKVVWLGLVIASACGGRVEGGDAGGPAAGDLGDDGRQQAGRSGDDDAGSADDGDQPGSVVIGVCPANPPASGMACGPPGQGCLYDEGLPTCQAFACLADGHWASVPPACR